ncbi:hypothetical protein [Henriciella sp.]|uniref:hypothetical protein n=1 Tax=Henriciella sp. TaxID=1968823 RepID=UPI0017EF8938|nr:hypothetical protein [Henriciella sp.]HIG22782.1 hypothetical protein [Henriciella sp.]
MKRHGLIIFSTLAIAGSLKAHAQAACASLNAAGDVLQEVRLLKVSESPSQKNERFAEIGRLLPEVPRLEGRPHRGVKSALFDPVEFDWYFERLSVAVSASSTGHELTQFRVASASIPPEVGMTLIAFLRSEGCIAADEGARELSGGGSSIGTRYASRQYSDSVGTRVSRERNRPTLPARASPDEPVEVQVKAKEGLSRYILPLSMFGASLSLAGLLFRPWIRMKGYESAPRNICERSGLLLQGKKDRKVTVVDYNRDGIRVKHSGLSRRRDASIALGGKSLAGTIVWRNKTYAGFVFELPLDDEIYEWLIDTLTDTTTEARGEALSSVA